VVRGLSDEDYGSRGFSVRDHEGRLWSSGTYPGEGRYRLIPAAGAEITDEHDRRQGEGLV
jgi:hypothetical protein